MARGVWGKTPGHDTGDVELRHAAGASGANETRNFTPLIGARNLVGLGWGRLARFSTPKRPLLSSGSKVFKGSKDAKCRHTLANDRSAGPAGEGSEDRFATRLPAVAP